MVDSFIGEDGVEYVVLKHNPFAHLSEEQLEEMRERGIEDLGFERGDNGELIDVMPRCHTAPLDYRQVSPYFKEKLSFAEIYEQESKEDRNLGR